MQFKTDLVFGSACWHYKFQTSNHVFAAYLLSSCSHVYVLIMSCSCCCAWNPLNIYQIFKQWLFKAHSLQFQWVSYLCIKFSFREPNKKNVCLSVSTCSHIFTIVCSIYSSGINRTPTFLSEFKSNTHMSQCEVTIIDPNIVILWEIKGLMGISFHGFNGNSFNGHFRYSETTV